MYLCLNIEFRFFIKIKIYDETKVITKSCLWQLFCYVSKMFSFYLVFLFINTMIPPKKIHRSDTLKIILFNHFSGV